MGWTIFAPILVFLGRFIRSRLIGQHVSDASRDLATLEVTAVVGDTGLRVPSVYLPS